MEHILIILISILTFGIGAQWLAWRLRVPSILLLLLVGFLAGPITGFLKPDELFGDLLFPWVSMSVAIILFEGGLSLRIGELKKIGSTVRNLASIGILVAWGMITWAAIWVLGFDFKLALLLGAILVVTGPTVIMPMLRTLRLSDRMSSILKWEAMLNDPIGAILAVLVFESMLAASGVGAATHSTLFGLLSTVVVGVGLGVIATWIMKNLLKRYWVPDFLHSAFTLMMVLTVFGLSNMLQAESGLVAVTIVGVLLANQKEIMVKHIVEFKENLRVLLISTLFIVLGSRLQLNFIAQIGWPHFAFLGLLLFVVRPMTVFVSTLGSGMNWREKVFLSWLCPRGIVAAAVASIFALHLENAGYPQADKIFSVTFFVIVSTVMIYGITTPLLAGVLRLSEPNPQGVLIGGGHEWARRMALALKKSGFRVLLIDTNSINVRIARSEGISAIRRDILSESVVDEIELSGIGRFLALTPNNEVNSLATIQFAEVFSRAEVYQLASAEKDISSHRVETKSQLYGRLLFSEKATYSFLDEKFELGAKIQSIALTEDYKYDAYKKEYGNRSTVLFIMTNASKELKVVTADQNISPKAGQTIIALVDVESKSS